MARVKIKHPKPTPEAKTKILKVLSQNLIYVTRIIEAHDGFIVLTRNDEELDKIFQAKCAKELKNENFTPVLPPELRARRTVMIFNLDPIIYGEDEKDIEAELIKENAWINDGIDSIFKFSKGNMMKITFNETSAARKATETGILAFSMSIPKRNIKIEDYIHITTCMRCYRLDHHTTNQCPMQKTYEICSECGESDHTWRHCKSSTKQCINCLGPHRTLANRCPERKKIRDRKIKEKRQSKTTYSQITSSTTFTSGTPNPTGNLHKDTAAKILTCMMHAHLQNIANPGCYNTEANKLFKANNLPQVILPDNPPSLEIFNIANATPEKEIHREEMETQEAHAQVEEREENEEEEVDVGTKNIENEEDDMPELEQIKGKDVGIEIITKSSSGWPSETIGVRYIFKAIESGKFKWTYSNSAFSEENIMNYLKSNEINLKDCFRMVDDQVFRKIRNGLTKQRTPPDNRSKPRRLSN